VALGPGLPPDGTPLVTLRRRHLTEDNHAHDAAHHDDGDRRP
jgi:hypothetical protein